MTAWVGVGIVLMVLGVYTTLWISFLGACVIGSTPVFFTLRAALSPRRPPKRAARPAAGLPQPCARPQQAARRRAPPRRRGHD